VQGARGFSAKQNTGYSYLTILACPKLFGIKGFVVAVVFVFISCNLQIDPFYTKDSVR
jgi:hypothetical protein